MKTLDARRKRATRAWQGLQASDRPVIYVGAASCGLRQGPRRLSRPLRATCRTSKRTRRSSKWGVSDPAISNPLWMFRCPEFPGSVTPT